MTEHAFESLCYLLEANTYWKYYKSTKLQLKKSKYYSLDTAIGPANIPNMRDNMAQWKEIPAPTLKRSVMLNKFI